MGTNYWGSGPPGQCGKRRTKTRRKGTVSMASMAFLTVFASLAVTFLSVTSLNLQQANNLAHIHEAQLQAESGLAFLCYRLGGMTVPPETTGRDLMLAVATQLRQTLDGSSNLAGGGLVHDPNGPEDPNDLNSYNDPNTVTIPSIVTAPDKSFHAVLTLKSDTTLHLTVTGVSGFVSRSVGIDLSVPDPWAFFGQYGIASRGQVAMTGNARVRGANDPSEANVLSATYSPGAAVDLCGNCCIEGDVAISNPGGYVDLAGNVSVGGEDLWSGGIDDHIHTGVGNVEFPEVDPSVFEPLAINPVDAATPSGGDLTFENIRILANTNKTFSGNITLKGVIFIEQPNDIHFSGNVTITGVIVTQDAGEDGYESNKIKFSGNTTVQDVSQLDGPQFEQLKQMPGAFLLAPGFGVEFTGNFGTVAGWMAADTFKWTGNAGGTVKGGIISYADTEFKLTGNSCLTFDRSGCSNKPAGFAPMPSVLQVQPSSYVEY